ncbi:hypothetical protein Leryth_005874, partial [Lithospermum erythrorhizon]
TSLNFIPEHTNPNFIKIINNFLNYFQYASHTASSKSLVMIHKISYCELQQNIKNQTFHWQHFRKVTISEAAGVAMVDPFLVEALQTKNVPISGDNFLTLLFFFGYRFSKYEFNL